MDDPRYGTIEPEDIPYLTHPGVKGRLLAGLSGDKRGPFETVQSVQIIDYEIDGNTSHTHEIPSDHDNCIVYIYRGSGIISDTKVIRNAVLRFDGTDPTKRCFDITNYLASEVLGIIIFSGKMIKEKIAWHGPFVMNSDAEIQKTISDYRSGHFLKKRTNWDYKRIATKPMP